MRKLAFSVAALAAYVALSSLLHYVVFPEPYASDVDLPRRGTEIVNEKIRSRFVFRRTPIETEGRLLEVDNFVEPGGGPIRFPHVHPRMRETFHVVEGEVRFVVDGEEHVVLAGSDAIVPPGAAHAFENASGQRAYMIARLEAVAEAPWPELAARGLLPDSGFVQMDRAGGVGGVSLVQAIVFGSRFKDVYPPGPRWLAEGVSFLVAPSARLFGVRAYYPPTPQQP